MYVFGYSSSRIPPCFVWCLGETACSHVPALHLAHRSLFCGNAAFERPSELKSVVQCIPASLLWLIYFSQGDSWKLQWTCCCCCCSNCRSCSTNLGNDEIERNSEQMGCSQSNANVHVPHPKTKIGFTFSDLESGLVLGFSMFFPPSCTQVHTNTFWTP